MEGGNLFMQLVNFGFQWGADRIMKKKPMRLADIMPETTPHTQETASQQLTPSSRSAPGVSNTEVINYQNTELLKNMLLFRGHLVQGCKINGKPCNCCEKHPTLIEGLAEETIPMTNKAVYGDIARFVRKVAPMTTQEAVASGKYDDEYPKLAAELRDLTKRVMLEAVPSQSK